MWKYNESKSFEFALRGFKAEKISATERKYALKLSKIIHTSLGDQSIKKKSISNM